MKKKSLFSYLFLKFLKNIKDNFFVYLLIISVIAFLGLSNNKDGVEDYLKIICIKLALMLFIFIFYFKIKRSNKIQKTLNSDYWQDHGSRM